MNSIYKAAVVLQSVGTIVSHTEGWVFESQPQQKQVVTAPMPNAWHQVRVSRVLGDDHFKPVSQYVWYAKEPLLLNA